MFDKEEFKRLNIEREEITDNEFLLDITWKKIINLICQENDTFHEFLKYMITEMTGEEYINLSEISMDVAGITVSLDFAEAFRGLETKYPEETARYHIKRFIEDAAYVVNFFSKDEKVRIDHLKRWFDDDPEFIEPYLTKKYT